MVGAGRRNWAQGHSPRGKPGRRRQRRRSAAHVGHTVDKFAVLRAPGRVRRAPNWRCARPSARRLASCMDDLDGTGQGSPRAHAPPTHGSSVDQLSVITVNHSVRSTDCSARHNAMSGTAMQKRRHPRGSCRARSFCPLLCPFLSCDEHNCSCRNSWPQTLLSLRSQRTHRTRHPTRQHRAHTVDERGTERLAPRL